MGSLVVLPPVPDAVVRALAASDQPVHVIEPVPGPEGSLAARICAAITGADPEPPLTIVAAGVGAVNLPAVARAQHSAHRRVVGYLLVDPVLPAVTDTWPDAHVTVVSDDEWTATQTRLRGWDLAPSITGWSVNEG